MLAISSPSVPGLMAVDNERRNRFSIFGHKTHDEMSGKSMLLQCAVIARHLTVIELTMWLSVCVCVAIDS